MVTLLLSTSALPASTRLAKAAARRGWASVALDKTPDVNITGEIVFYGSLLVAMEVARRFDLALIEPPLDLLARLPRELLLRKVEYWKWEDVPRFSQPIFLKPADPLAKVFDAGVYRAREQVGDRVTVPPDAEILMSEPVEWLTEHRCFVLEGKVVASSQYLSFGRPLQHRAGKGISALPAPVAEICRRLVSLAKEDLPPAFVVDVGLIEDRGWAIVEFNPVWCAGLMSADPDAVLDVLRRACKWHGRPAHGDGTPSRWSVLRPK